jgi:hypothetical protein
VSGVATPIGPIADCFWRKVISADVLHSLRQTQKAVDSARAARRKKWICFWICSACNVFQRNPHPEQGLHLLHLPCLLCLLYLICLAAVQHSDAAADHPEQCSSSPFSPSSSVSTLVCATSRNAIHTRVPIPLPSRSLILPLYTPFIPHRFFLALKRQKRVPQVAGMRDAGCGMWDVGCGMGSLWAGLGMGKRMQSVHPIIFLFFFPIRNSTERTSCEYRMSVRADAKCCDAAMLRCCRRGRLRAECCCDLCR